MLKLTKFFIAKIDQKFIAKIDQKMTKTDENLKFLLKFGQKIVRILAFNLSNKFLIFGKIYNLAKKRRNLGQKMAKIKSKFGEHLKCLLKLAKKLTKKFEIFV